VNIGRDHSVSRRFRLSMPPPISMVRPPRQAAAMRSLEIVVDEAQDRLAIPHAAMLRELIGWRPRHHIALMRMNANNTMRSSMKPCRKREIWVSP
jgi:hypothetical protein